MWLLSGTVENVKLHEEQLLDDTVGRANEPFQLHQEQIQLNDHGEFILKMNVHVL